MTGKVDEPSTTNGLQYPMVNLFTGGTILPLMFVNVAATCYLLSLTAPLAFICSGHFAIVVVPLSGDVRSPRLLSRCACLTRSPRQRERAESAVLRGRAPWRS